MRKKICLLALCLLVLSLVGITAYAADISLSASRNNSTGVISVSGTADAGAEVTLTYSRSGSHVRTVTPDTSSGLFSDSYTVAEGAYGSYTIQAAYTDGSLGSGDSQSVFMGYPITLSAVANQGDSTLTLSGSAYGNVLLTLNGTDGSYTVTPVSGVYSLTTPPLSPGTYQVVAAYANDDGSYGSRSATDSATLNAPAQAAPAIQISVTPGDNQLTVSGVAQAQTEIRLELSGPTAGNQTLTTDGSGAFSASFTGLAAGTYALSASYTQITGNGASLPGIVIADPVTSTQLLPLSISVQPSPGTVRVTGTGSAGAQIRVDLTGGPSPSAQTIAIGTGGTFAVNFTSLGAGTYAVAVSYTQGSGVGASQGTIVVAAGNAIELTDAAGGVKKVAVEGQVNYAAASPTLMLTVGTHAKSFQPEADGTFSVDIDIPTAGYYDVTVSDATDLAVSDTWATQVRVLEAMAADAISITSVTTPADNQILIAGTASPASAINVTAASRTVGTNSDAAGNFQVLFSGLAAGSYSGFTAAYASGDPKTDTWSGSVTVTDGSTPGARAPVTITKIEKTSDTSLAVTVTFEAGETVSIELGGTTRTFQDGGNAGTVTLAFTVAKPAQTQTFTATAQYTTTPYLTTTKDFVYEISSTPRVITLSLVTDDTSIRVNGTAEPGKDVILSISGGATGSETLSADATTGGFGKRYTGLAPAAYSITARYADGSGLVTTQQVTLADPDKPALQVDLITNATTVITGKTLAGLKVTVRTTFGSTQYSASATADTRGVFRIPLPRTQDVGKQVEIDVTESDGTLSTYTFTVAQDPGAQYRNLRVGSSGSDVLNLQQRLRDLGYDVDVTGYYDYKTQSAVRSFQYINGLGLDGIAGRETQTTLYSVAARPYTTSGATYPRLQRGDRSNYVTQLQARLAELGYYTIRVDGIFGVATQAGVRAFQLNNGLAATGIADEVTQSLLFSSAAKPIGSYNNIYTLLRRGSRGTQVSALQTRLSALGYYTGLIDGIYGSQTEAAVRSFQSYNNLGRTGTADTATQTVLFSNNAWPKTGGSSGGGGGSSTGYVYLYWGCENQAVSRLQTALKSAGYYSGNIDGQYYIQTYNAVKAFQRANGLAVDGIAGRKTQNKLYGTNY